MLTIARVSGAYYGPFAHEADARSYFEHIGKSAKDAEFFQLRVPSLSTNTLSSTYELPPDHHPGQLSVYDALDSIHDHVADEAVTSDRRTDGPRASSRDSGHGDQPNL